MKFITLFFLVFSLIQLAQSRELVWKQSEVNLDEVTTEQQLSTTALKVQSATVFASSANSGTIYITPQSGKADAGTSVSLAAGNSITITGDILSGSSSYVDLSKWYFDGTSTNDDVIIWYAAEE